MLSVNTNYNAAVALQSLNATQQQLAIVQNQISTGQKVSSAKDNGAVYAIAQGQRSRVTSIAAVNDGISRASSAIDVALTAGNSIGSILQQMKTQAVSAQAQDLTANQRSAIQATYDSLRAQIGQIANSSQFNGINLVDGSGTNLNVMMSDLNTGNSGRQVTSTAIAGLVPSTSAYVAGNNSAASGDTAVFNIGGNAIGTVTLTATMTINQYLSAVSTATGGRVAASYDSSNGTFKYVAPEASAGASTDLTVTGTSNTWLGTTGAAATAAVGATSTTTINGLDFTAGGAGALSTVSTASDLMGTAASATTVAGNIDTAISTLNAQLATLGSQSTALGIQTTFNSTLSDTINQGVSNLTDADLAKASAQLQSLQVKQQLGAQALSIANQSPSLILSFFK